MILMDWGCDGLCDARTAIGKMETFFFLGGGGFSSFFLLFSYVVRYGKDLCRMMYVAIEHW